MTDRTRFCLRALTTLSLPLYDSSKRTSDSKDCCMSTAQTFSKSWPKHYLTSPLISGNVTDFVAYGHISDGLWKQEVPPTDSNKRIPSQSNSREPLHEAALLSSPSTFKYLISMNWNAKTNTTSVSPMFNWAYRIFIHVAKYSSNIAQIV